MEKYEWAEQKEPEENNAAQHWCCFSDPFPMLGIIFTKFLPG